MEDFIKVVGIDPGNNTGIAILSLDPNDLKIKNIETRTIRLNRYSHDEYDYTRLSILRDIATDLYYYVRPNIIAMEVAFLNMKYPKAVMQLSQYTGTIETTIKSIDPNMLIFKYPPMYVKSVAAGTGKAEKDDMRDAVKKNKELNKLVDTVNTTEHEIDAVCIAYTSLREIRETPFYLLAIS